MRIIPSFPRKTSYAMAVVITTMLVACQHTPSSDKIPFDEKNAITHIRPYDTLITYIESFRDLRSRPVNNAIMLDTSKVPLAESFNRDAIIALLNAPNAKNMRIYLGRKSDGTIAFCILPVDSAGNDIAVRLVGTDRRAAIKIPGISSAEAAPVKDAQGLEEGQRCPTMCSK